MENFMTQLVLGIESSCDETAAAIVAMDKRVLSNIVYSQLDDHRPYGGVVPEIAARAHVTAMDDVVARALAEAAVHLSQIDAIAVTSGPGLIGGVIVGVMTAKALAAVAKKPLLGINHLEGHALTPRLTSDVQFPYLLMLMSGGHCQILRVEGVGKYIRLGTTRDDAAGEAFDKVAKMLGLPYPGGPQVEQAALCGQIGRFTLPTPMLGADHCDFSFSGLKTAVLRQIEQLEAANHLDKQARADLCAAFQMSVAKVLVDRLTHAYRVSEDAGFHAMPCVVAGGVAANAHLRGALQAFCSARGVDFIAPPMKLCTDNAAMIAWAGCERLLAGVSRASEQSIEPRARWPLHEMVA